MRGWPELCVLAFWVGCAARISAAQSVPDEWEGIAKLRANPLSGLRSVTMGNTVNFADSGEVQIVFAPQAVWPVSLGGDWTLVTDTTLSVISQPESGPGDGRVLGLGDTLLTTVVTPKETGNLIWGLGPALVLPTATDSALGSGRWAAGPTLALFVQPDQWTFGVLLDNVWSFDRSGSDAVNELCAQYFLNYNLPHGWFLESNESVTADWEADRSDRWTVPVGAGVGKLLKIAELPVSAAIGAYYNAVRPGPAADWSLSIQFQLLFPS